MFQSCKNKLETFDSLKTPFYKGFVALARHLSSCSSGSRGRRLRAGGLRGCRLPPCGKTLVSQDDGFNIILKHQRCKVANRGGRPAFKKQQRTLVKGGNDSAVKAQRRKVWLLIKYHIFSHKLLKIPTERKHSDDFSSHPCVKFA